MDYNIKFTLYNLLDVAGNAAKYGGLIYGVNGLINGIGEIPPVINAIIGGLGFIGGSSLCYGANAGMQELQRERLEKLIRK